MPLSVSRCPSVTIEVGLGHPTALRCPSTKAHGFQRPFFKTLGEKLTPGEQLGVLGSLYFFIENFNNSSLLLT